METTREWQLFLQGLLWGLLLFRIFPPMFKDIVKVFKELFLMGMENSMSFFKRIRKMWLEIRENEKNPADGTAERNKKNISKYSITNSCTDFHSQNLERWS